MIQHATKNEANDESETETVNRKAGPDAGVNVAGLLAEAMGDCSGFPPSVDPDSCSHETPNYSICRCDVRPGLVNVDAGGARRTFRCPQCKVEVTEGATTATRDGGRQ